MRRRYLAAITGTTTMDATIAVASSALINFLMERAVAQAGSLA